MQTQQMSGINEGITMRGALTILVRDKRGRIKTHRKVKNLVVTVGKNFIASRMTATPTAMSHMAVGTTRRRRTWRTPRSARKRRESRSPRARRRVPSPPTRRRSARARARVR